MHYGDPDALDLLAARLSRAADRVGADAATVRNAIAAMTWRGRAAEAFRATAHTDVQRLTTAATRLEDAASELRRQAEDLRAVIARIHAIEKAAQHWFAEQEHNLRRLAETAADKVVDAARDPVGTVRRAAEAVHEALWEHWRWRPTNLPLPGSREWLDVGTFLASRGVQL